jgi:Phage antirepressor protein KilAC domain
VNNSIEQYQSFNQDGLELVINTATGEAFASQRATARMLGVDPVILRRLRGEDKLAIKTAEINTPGGLQGVSLITAQDIFKLAVKYNPELAIKMGTAGATVYVYGLAGYSIKPVEKPVLKQPALPTIRELALMVIAAEDKADALAAQIEADSGRTELGRSIEAGKDHLRIGEFAKQIGMGQNLYFRELKDCGIIMMSSRLPYQKYMQYFKITQVCHNGNWYQVSLINPKGQVYLAKRHKQWQEREVITRMIEAEVSAIV